MAQTYAIKGGRSGRERLRVLSNVLQAGTHDFLDKVGVRPGMACLDVGCGGGEVAHELARRVGVSGRVVGLDMDADQLEIVRAEAAAQNIQNIDYRVVEVTDPPRDLGSFDLVYTRFFLCHLTRPTETLLWMVKCRWVTDADGVDLARILARQLQDQARHQGALPRPEQAQMSW